MIKFDIRLEQHKEELPTVLISPLNAIQKCVVRIKILHRMKAFHAWYVTECINCQLFVINWEVILYIEDNLFVFCMWQRLPMFFGEMNELFSC